MTTGRPHEAVPQEMLADVRMDLPPVRSSVQQPMPASSLSNASGRPLSLDTDRVPTMNLRMPQQEVIFRILCSNERVGGVIGKGGTIVRALQNESGASISVANSIADCEERLITITATEVCMLILIFSVLLLLFVYEFKIYVCFFPLLV